MGDNSTGQSGSYPSDIGELDVMATSETEDSGTSPGDSLDSFDVEVVADFADRPVVGEFDIDVLEGAGAEVADDGTIVADVVTVSVDEASGFAVIDEVIGVITPEGTQITEERVSVLDPDGNFTAIAEEVDVFTDAEG